jgi:hypothetical protein
VNVFVAMAEKKAERTKGLSGPGMGDAAGYEDPGRHAVAIRMSSAG